MGTNLHAARDEATAEGTSPTRTRVVYTNAPLQLGKLIAREEDGRWRLELAGENLSVAVASDVDPALLDEIVERSGRVLVERGADGKPQIAGVVQTQRNLTIDADGEVNAKVQAFRVQAERELLLSSAQAFVRVKRRDIELYGGEVLTRARDVARILGRLISLN